MQEEIQIPKSYRVQLDELEVGQSIVLESDEERNKFSATAYREFHSLDDCEKHFTVKKDRTTKERKIWRIK